MVLTMAALVLAAAAVLPQDTTAPTIADTYVVLDNGSANVFYVDEIDGESAARLFEGPNMFQDGFALRFFMREHTLTAQPHTLTLVANRDYKRPIRALESPEYALGEVRFEPQPGGRYQVRGYMSRSYAAAWIEDTTGATVSTLVERYDEDDPDGLRVRDEVRRARVLPVPERSRIDMYLQLALGDTVGVVAAKLGEPDAVAETSFNLLKRTPALRTLTYRGLGDVVFYIRKEQTSLARIVPALQDADPLTTARAALNADSAALRPLARHYFEQGVDDVAVLDLFAAKIWAERASEDDEMVDAIAFLIKTLGRSGEARYRTLLTTLVEQGDGKLRRHARNSLELLKGDDVPQFVPGDESAQ